MWIVLLLSQWVRIALFPFNCLTFSFSFSLFSFCLNSMFRLKKEIYCLSNCWTSKRPREWSCSHNTIYPYHNGFSTIFNDFQLVCCRSHQKDHKNRLLTQKSDQESIERAGFKRFSQLKCVLWWKKKAIHSAKLWCVYACYGVLQCVHRTIQVHIMIACFFLPNAEIFMGCPCSFCLIIDVNDVKTETPDHPSIGCNCYEMWWVA